ncbi:AfsR/SARP family transcriptional regulator [Streptomyces asiaticus]|uniref:AfsR/SARP family transcriptional regulator n=1 Tax=Streptomyces asiaticus TaxID=114695 RepID=UPI003D746582
MRRSDRYGVRIGKATPMCLVGRPRKLATSEASTNARDRLGGHVLSFRVLGPLEIGTPTQVVRPKGFMQRKLLTVLLANAGNLVPIDPLINELWQEKPPAHVENALQAHVSRLRQKLADWEPDAGTARLVAFPAGYQLNVDEGELDAEIFRAGLERIRDHSADDPAVTVRELRSLLDLWRGPALHGMAGTALCQAAICRLEESRIAALELLYENELELGNYGRVIPELREQLTDQPFRERFWQQLLIALQRSGRHTEARVVYQELRRKVSQELGLDPSPIMHGFDQPS